MVVVVVVGGVVVVVVVLLLVEVVLVVVVVAPQHTANVLFILTILPLMLIIWVVMFATWMFNVLIWISRLHIISSIFCNITLSVSHGSTIMQSNTGPLYSTLLDRITLVSHGFCPQPVLGSVELHPQGLFKTTSVQQGLTGKKGYDIVLIYWGLYWIYKQPNPGWKFGCAWFPPCDATVTLVAAVIVTFPVKLPPVPVVVLAEILEELGKAPA